MRIAVHLDHSRLLRWHLALITALQQAGHEVAAEFRVIADPLPVSLIAILDFDAVRSGSGRDSLAARITPATIAERAGQIDGAADLTIDVSISATAERLAGRVLRPLYDGSATDEALFQALLAGRAPLLAVYDTDESGVWTIGLPATEQPTRLTRSLENVTSRLIEGLVAIIARIGAGERAPPEPNDKRDLPRTSLLASELRFATHRLAAKLGRIRDLAFRDRPRWRVAWRHLGAGEPSLQGPADLRLSDFNLLEDDGRRFYADPMVVVRDGAIHVFIEEMPDDTRIGLISHFTISATGEATRPEPVLSATSHLSYPFVFERDGETWMMPESSAAGGLDLYRCQRFPDRWELEARLIEGRFHDATLFAHGGQLWIAAGTEALQSSTWDALSLFYAPSLRGPWRPHAKNPVLVDARWARPAGPLFHDGGDLIRPAQDCSNGYGSRLSLRKLLRLTPDDYAEETVGTIAFGNDRGVLGPHTLCRGGGLEFIDLQARDSELRQA